MRQLLIVSILYISIAGCSDKNAASSAQILDSDKMQIVLWDLFQADAFTENFVKKDSSKNSSLINAGLQKKIFELHKVKKEDFYKSYNYYSAHPDLMHSILDSITAKAERENGKLMKERYSGSHATE